MVYWYGSFTQKLATLSSRLDWGLELLVDPALLLCTARRDLRISQTRPTTRAVGALGREGQVRRGPQVPFAPSLTHGAQLAARSQQRVQGGMHVRTAIVY